jgi:hypothetical protein
LKLFTSQLPNLLLFLLILVFNTHHSFAQQPGLTGLNSGSSSVWVGAEIGPGILIEKAPDTIMPEIQDYLNKLRSGRQFGFESEYFFNKYIGVGAKYVIFNTKQAVDSIVVEFFSHIFYIDLSSDMSIHTVSPMVYGKLPLLKDKLAIIGGVGPAWLFYRNIGKAIDDTAMFKGSSPGISTSLRISYEVFHNLHVALQCGYIHAFLKEFTQDNGTTQQTIKLDKQNYQNISRLDYSFGLFYTFRRK